MLTLSQEEECFLERICQARGFQWKQWCQEGLADICDYRTLAGIQTIADHLSQAIIQRTPLIVVGDYDVDGAVSTALMVRALRAMGATEVTYRAPHRMSEGYGLSVALSETLPASGGVLITVDNGIRALEGAQVARERGWKVLITDHHDPGPQLPEVEGLVNPKLQRAPPFGAPNLAGVGVALYVILALRNELVQKGWFDQASIKAPNCAQWLDLVCIGTIADMVPLDRTNRILVMQGLRRIRAGVGTIGVQALIEHLGYGTEGTPKGLMSTQTISYRLAPLINAAGRMDDIGVAIDLLLTDDPNQAQELIKGLSRFNLKRRRVQATMIEEAIKQVESGHWSPPDAAALLVCNPEWHLGIIGILASQLKDRYQRPVAVFAEAQGVLRGSLRSMPGLNLAELMAQINKVVDGMLQFGGHAMAAGVTLRKESLPEFSLQFAALAHQRRDPSLLAPSVTDGSLEGAYMTLKVASLLQQSIPWGTGCAEPCFEGTFKLWLKSKVRNGSAWRLVLQPSDTQDRIEAIWFSDRSQTSIEQLNLMSLVSAQYQLGLNYYAGSLRLQILIKEIRTAKALCDLE